LNYYIHPDAEAELGDAAVFYAASASPKIANAFLTEFDHLRTYHFNRFPFTVVYEESKTLGP
jgi:hypothetical protein